MSSPRSCLRSWHPVLYLHVTSVPHLKSPPHPKTPSYHQRNGIASNRTDHHHGNKG